MSYYKTIFIIFIFIPSILLSENIKITISSPKSEYLSYESIWIYVEVENIGTSKEEIPMAINHENYYCVIEDSNGRSKQGKIDYVFGHVVPLKWLYPGEKETGYLVLYEQYWDTSVNIAGPRTFEAGEYALSITSNHTTLTSNTISFSVNQAEGKEKEILNKYLSAQKYFVFDQIKHLSEIDILGKEIIKSPETAYGSQILADLCFYYLHYNKLLSSMGMGIGVIRNFPDSYYAKFVLEKRFSSIYVNLDPQKRIEFSKMVGELVNEMSVSYPQLKGSYKVFEKESKKVRGSDHE